MKFIIGRKTIPQAADSLIAAVQNLNIEDGILYIGYPLLATADDRWELDAMMTCAEYGVIVFDFAEGGLSPEDDFWAERQDYQSRLFMAIQSQLMRHPSLTKRRQLMVPIEVVTFVPAAARVKNQGELNLADPSSLGGMLVEVGRQVPEEYLKALNAAFQRVASIRPQKKRQGVMTQNSKGAILREIEKEIANLDRHQMVAAIESPEGPQRVRGLAGSGKTVVLALKAAYMHASHPDWTIAVTFHTRSLYRQFSDLVRRFSIDYLGDEPDPKKLRILHSWGSQGEPGVYYEIASHYQVPPRNFAYAKAMYGQDQALKGICDELLVTVEQDRSRPPLFDAILIDEAQDLPDSFFKLAYRVVPNPKYVIWAYDELQNLGGYSMQPPKELFGNDADGNPLVPTLHNHDNQPHQDVILPVCYRNTPWALVVAHALGFGIYRAGGDMVQLFDDADLWDAIGYEEVDGVLEPGHEVTLARKSDSYPDFFKRLFHDQGDLVEHSVFESDLKQAQAVAQAIHSNITLDELEPSDILVIFPDPISVTRKAQVLSTELGKLGIKSHVAGVDIDRDRLFLENSVAISGIFRAKGNEAPLVYVLSAEYCYDGFELARKRNILFTAITRSRAWVRIYGVGPDMLALCKELREVEKNGYRLKFRVPTEEQLAKMRRIHRDMTPEERDSFKKFDAFLRDIERGKLPKEALSNRYKRRLMRLLEDQRH